MNSRRGGGLDSVGEAGGVRRFVEVAAETENRE